MELLKCESLTKIYGSGPAKVTALDHVDLAVEKGEFVAIIGTSGSGKSTLLHLLGGVDRPDDGRIRIEGTDIATLGEKQLAVFRRRKVGLVYQFYNLIPSLTVRQNILLPMLLDNQKPDEKRFSELVETLGLTDRLSHLPNQLSGGQQQRAAIARALIYRPAILLADEPTGNLDKRNSEEILALLKLSNKKYRQTILLITHDEKIALEADRIIAIEDGRILSDSANGRSFPNRADDRPDGTASGYSRTKGMPASDRANGCPASADMPMRSDRAGEPANRADALSDRADDRPDGTASCCSRTKGTPASDHADGEVTA